MDILVRVLIGLSILVFCYLFLIMPRMVGRPDIAPFLRWLYAHRGLHDNGGDAPENSLRAFQRAVEAGYGIELDVQLSKDQVPVVFHDFTLERVCGAKGRVCDLTWEELEKLSLCGTDQRIPRLEEALSLVDGRVPLIIELKIEETDISVCPVVDGLLSKYGGMYCIESFNPLGVFWYRRNRRRVVRGQLSDAFYREGEYMEPIHFFLQNLLFNWLAKPDFIAYNRKYPKTLPFRLCRSLYGCTAAAWTIRSEEELREAGNDFDFFIFDSFVPEKTFVLKKTQGSAHL